MSSAADESATGSGAADERFPARAGGAEPADAAAATATAPPPQALPPGAADPIEPSLPPSSLSLQPFRRVKGIGAAWNFTIGPALIYEGRKTIDVINKLNLPHVIIAEYLSEEELRKIELTRCLGFVIERGAMVDPTFWKFYDENRATVICARNARAYARNKEPVIVDGVRGVALFGPDDASLDNYQALRKLGPPREDVLYRETLRHLTTAIMGTYFRKQLQPPFQFSEHERLIEVAKRARQGKTTKEDDDWMMSILVPEMPPLENVQQHPENLEQLYPPEKDKILAEQAGSRKQIEGKAEVVEEKDEKKQDRAKRRGRGEKEGGEDDGPAAPEPAGGGGEETGFQT
jgi:hypothetical protein